MNDSSNKKNTDASKLALSREQLKDLTKLRTGLRTGVACNAGSCNDPTSENTVVHSKAACTRF